MKLPLPPGSFQAYLFDCDGTIADSMPLHYVAWSRALGEWDCVFEEELFYGWAGKPPAEIIARLNQMQGLNMPVAAVAEQKERFYYKLLPQLQPVAEVLEHIKAQDGRILYAIVSGSGRDSVLASLSALGLVNKFAAIVCEGDYVNSKPHPEPFLLAASRLGVIPEQCLVFEDSDLGIQAATAAGMASVKVQRCSPCTRLTASLDVDAI
jgi:HAD superfamily hydrolase (TIGR01509 family)